MEILDKGSKPETKNFATGSFTIKITYFQSQKNELDQLEKVDEIKELFGLFLRVEDQEAKKDRYLLIKEYSHDFTGEYSDILQISIDIDYHGNTTKQNIAPTADDIIITMGKE